jgi:hypothetical protein
MSAGILKATKMSEMEPAGAGPFFLKRTNLRGFDDFQPGQTVGIALAIGMIVVFETHTCQAGRKP